MPDILHDFPINAPLPRVFDAVSKPTGLDQWWTKTSRGAAHLGMIYELGFGPGYDWKAVVTLCEPGSRFELQMTDADADWKGTRVGFEFAPNGSGTNVRFYHRGWPAENAHYRTSCFCWAMYLRVLRRNLEFGESVPYEKRLDV